MHEGCPCCDEADMTRGASPAAIIPSTFKMIGFVGETVLVEDEFTANPSMAELSNVGVKVGLWYVSRHILPIAEVIEINSASRAKELAFWVAVDLRILSASVYGMTICGEASLTRRPQIRRQYRERVSDIEICGQFRSSSMKGS